MGRALGGARGETQWGRAGGGAGKHLLPSSRAPRASPATEPPSQVSLLTHSLEQRFLAVLINKCHESQAKMHTGKKQVVS